MKYVCSCIESLRQGNWQYTFHFHAVLSKVSSFMGNPVIYIYDEKAFSITLYTLYRASHIILDYLQSLTPKYAHYTQKI